MADPEQASLLQNTDSLPSYNGAAGTIQEPRQPLFDSLSERVKAAKSQSRGTVDFTKRFFDIILSTIGFTALLVISMALPVSMIVMGAVYLNDCPCERMIPIYLIVAGCLGSAKILLSAIKGCGPRKEEREENALVTFVTHASCLLIIAWFIAGNVYVYRTNGEFTSDPTDENYCNSTLYWFAFWVTSSAYILMTVSCCCVCFVGCLVEE